MFAACTALLLFAGQAPPPAEKADKDYLTEFRKIKTEMEKLQESVNKEYQAAKTEKEKEEVISRAIQTLNEKGRPLTDKAIAVVRPHAADKEAVQVLTWVLNNSPESQAARTAADLLVKHHVKDPATLDTASRFSHAPMPWTEKLLKSVADADVPKDRKALALLSLAECAKTKAEIPGMLKDLDPAMAKMVEARYGKDYMAELKAADPAKLEAEALRRFKELAEKYGSEKYGIQTVGDYARGAIFEMENLTVGKKAPEIAGEDIDGKKFKLSDYKGKVVVLDFWGNW